MGLSDAENVRVREKKQRKKARWGFPMLKVPEPEGKSNGKRCNGDFRCQKYQNQYLWKNLWNSAMKKVTISAKKCEENVKNCGQ